MTGREREREGEREREKEREKERDIDRVRQREMTCSLLTIVRLLSFLFDILFMSANNSRLKGLR